MKIAIIIPIYNQEKYLSTALDSLLAQTYSDWLAICVDDGSTDSSPRILGEYAARDGRFKVLTKANGGVSSARNAGLDAIVRMSSVTHVMFLDPDDFYHVQCLEMATAAARLRPCAVIGWSYANEDPEGFRSRRFAADEIRLSDALAGQEVWNKLFPISMIEDVRFFEEVSIAEDMAFLLEVFHRRHPQCGQLTFELGFYCEHGTSIMHRNLTEADFVERRTVVCRMLKTLADASDEQCEFCREQLPGLLKRFYRDLKRVAPSEAEKARRVFSGMLRELRVRGQLKPGCGSFKDLKYYFRFLWLAYRYGGQR